MALNNYLQLSIIKFSEDIILETNSLIFNEILVMKKMTVVYKM